MNHKLKHLKITSIFLLIILVLMPLMLISVIGNLENPNYKYSTKVDFTNVHRGFLFTSGDLGGYAEADTYQLKLKADKEYYFRIVVDYQYGSSIGLVLSNNDILEVKTEIGSWDSDDPKSMRKIIFTYTPTGGNYTLTLAKIDIYNVEDFKYSIYVNLAGFEGYWWMLLCGFLILLIIMMIIVSILRRSKKGKRKRSKRR
ncbi:MAG: hypothetical protein JXA54_15070 [Candidatus Heimdallarchaeota archaeon]|nr:hypothetical protein [Candidatus Heimdallarchaeota archaeon]